MSSLESISLLSGAARVKYSAFWQGSVQDFLLDRPNLRDVYYKTTAELADASQLLERSGAAPALEDDKLGGNVASRIVCDELDFLVVSKSGKKSGQPVSNQDDFCIVTEFDQVEWSLKFFANSSLILPTSDAPLHHAALYGTAQFNWTEVPRVSLHGHAVETVEKAEQLNLPCSTKETLFSTPEDMHEMLSLLKLYRYPEHKVFVRNGHGFLLLGKTVTEAVETFKTVIMPFIDQASIQTPEGCQQVAKTTKDTQKRCLKMAKDDERCQKARKEAKVKPVAKATKRRQKTRKMKDD